jgi:3-phosphoshikimate 1-carboxyvinyltransferase
MIAPRLPKGLTIQLTSEITSRPYLEMTLSMMERCGTDVKVSDREIRIEQGEYQVDHSLLEKDFSSAHYAWAWSQLVQKPIELKGLKLPALQGDAQFELCEPMWKTTQGGLQTVVHSTENFPREVHFGDSPDLAPTYICLYAALGLSGRFTGLHTLNQKESKRLDVLVRELSKAGYRVQSNGSDELELMGGSYSPHTFPTYDDHRMAMSFVLFGAIGKVEIENPEVVDKSFPRYWEMVFPVTSDR